MASFFAIFLSTTLNSGEILTASIKFKTPEDSVSGEIAPVIAAVELAENPTNPDEEALLNNCALLALFEGLALPFVRCESRSFLPPIIAIIFSLTHVSRNVSYLFPSGGIF